MSANQQGSLGKGWIDLKAWEPNHPEGTQYFLDKEKGTVRAVLPDGTEERYILGGRVQ